MICLSPKFQYKKWTSARVRRVCAAACPPRCPRTTCSPTPTPSDQAPLLLARTLRSGPASACPHPPIRPRFCSGPPPCPGCARSCRRRLSPAAAAAAGVKPLRKRREPAAQRRVVVRTPRVAAHAPSRRPRVGAGAVVGREARPAGPVDQG